MKTKSLLVVLVAFIVVTFAGCKKYDDGPTISPWPKKMRLVNTWKVEETFTLGFSTNGSDGYTIEFKGDGKVIQTGTMSGFAATGDSEWEWGDKKETIVYLGSEWTILRLTSNEFWVSGASGNFEVHYVSAK